jgi:hypothetical protein
VILFANLALYAGYHLFEKRRVRDCLGMTTAAILAPLSKGNGLVVCIVIVIAIALLQGRNGEAMTRGQTLLYGSIFVVGFVLVVPRAGLYWEHHRRYGTPFVIPIPPAPFPNAFEKTFVYKPGVTSIMDALVTFRLYDLLRNPVSTTDGENTPCIAHGCGRNSTAGHTLRILTPGHRRGDCRMREGNGRRASCAALAGRLGPRWMIQRSIPTQA